MNRLASIRRKRWLWSVSICLLAILGAVLVFRFSQPSNLVVLPDGRRLQLIGSVTNRQSIALSSETFFLRTARDWLPVAAQRWLPGRRVMPGVALSPDSFAVVVANAELGANSPLPDEWLWCVPEDDGGFRYELEKRPSLKREIGAGSFTPPLAVLKRFPRRQSSFLLHLQDGAGTNLATIRVDNPLATTFPTWKAEPFPVRRTNGPVVLVLKNVVREGRIILPEYGVVSDDARWIGARLDYLWYEDATGQTGRIAGELSTAESAWKLHGLLRRSYESFSEAERLVLPEVEIPPPGESPWLQIPAAAPQSFTGLVTGFITGLRKDNDWSETSPMAKMADEFPGFRPGYRMGFRADQDAPHVFLLVPGVGLDDRVVVHAWARDGKRFVVPSSLPPRVRSSKNVETVLFAGKLPNLPPGERLTLDVAISRPLEFEFLFDPKQIKPMKP